MQTRRHGEVSLIPTKTPKGAKLIKETKSFIVGHSESGHHHVLTATSPFKVYEHEGQTYIELTSEAKLTHQKTGEETHGVQILEPTTWLRVIKKSFSYASKVMRRVQD